MKYQKIKQKVNNLVIFSPNDLYIVDPKFRLPTLYDWESKGLVKKIRNNYYVFSDFDPFDKDFFLIANTIYSPSYVSLESALNYYGVIPELVPNTISVTTNKTAMFETCFGNFSYSTIHNNLFFGYNLVSHKPHEILIASIEKTILDYLYLNTNIDSMDDFVHLRWNKDVLKSVLDISVFEKYLIIFDNKALQKRALAFIEYLNA